MKPPSRSTHPQRWANQRETTSPSLQRRATRATRTLASASPPPLASLSARSGTLALSLQSPLHLSLAVLVRYRSPTGTEPWVGLTTRLELQSQAARLVGAPARYLHAGAAPRTPRAPRGSHPPWRPLPRDLARAGPAGAAPLQATPWRCRQFSAWAASLFTRRYWGSPRSFLFPPPTDMLKSGGSSCVSGGFLCDRVKIEEVIDSLQNPRTTIGRTLGPAHPLARRNP